MTLSRADVICFSSIDWDFIWQGHQEIMTTLVEKGNRVLFVENTGVCPPTFRDLPRLRQRICNWSRGTKGFRLEQESLSVGWPLILHLPLLAGGLLELTEPSSSAPSGGGCALRLQFDWIFTWPRLKNQV